MFPTRNQSQLDNVQFGHPEQIRVLIIEENLNAARLLKRKLESEHVYDMTLTHTRAEGFYLLCTDTFDLVLMGHSMWKIDNEVFLNVLRSSEIRIPVLFLPPDNYPTGTRRTAFLSLHRPVGSDNRIDARLLEAIHQITSAIGTNYVVT